VFINIR